MKRRVQVPRVLTNKLTRAFWQEKLKELFTVDLRSMAAFRVAIALVTLADLLTRATDLTAFYTDKGTLPRIALMALAQSRFSYSFHLMNGSAFFQSVLLFIACLFAVGMLVGYRTRLMSVLSWLMVVSIQERNPFILNGGDTLYRALMFWCMFLPLGARFSLDQALNSSKQPRRNLMFSVGTTAILVQVALVYIFVALHKTGQEWFPEGSAVYYALSLEQIRTSVGAYLLTFDARILRALTFGTLFFQWVGPFLLFSPIYTQRVRFFTALCFICMQIGFGLCMHLGIFPWTAGVAMIPFFPSFFWDHAARHLRRRQKRVQVLYDGASPPARLWSRVLKAFLLLPPETFRRLPEDASKPSLTDTYGRWMVRDVHENTQGGPAALSALLRASWVWRPLAVVAPVLYGQVIKQRGAFSKIFSPLRYRRINYVAGEWNNLFVGTLLAIVIAVNFTTLESFHHKLVGPLNIIRNSFRLTQSWTMFSPRPATEDGWYVVVGNSLGGQQFNLFDDDPKVSWERSPSSKEIYKNARWQKYMMNLSSPHLQAFRGYFAQYLCSLWNSKFTQELTRTPSAETTSLAADLAAAEPARVTEVEIFFMSKINQLNFHHTPIQKISKGKYECGF